MQTLLNILIGFVLGVAMKGAFMEPLEIASLEQQLMLDSEIKKQLNHVISRQEEIIAIQEEHISMLKDSVLTMIGTEKL